MLRALSTITLAFLVLAGSACDPTVEAQAAVTVPAPALDNPKSAGALEKAVLAGGCFWGVQGVFQHVKGVHNAVSGYSGGDKDTAEYETVSSGRTGHAESVEVTFDPQQISYGEILQIFFTVAHDPTQLNRQGPDTGTQYRSAIFYSNDAQRKIAEAYVTQLDAVHVFRRPIVTRIGPLDAFYPAEDYHQDYLLRNPKNMYIVFNDLPKIEDLKRTFPARFLDPPVTVARRAK